MSTFVAKVTKSFYFANEKGDEILVNGFEDGFVIVSAPINVSSYENASLIAIINENGFVSFLSGCFDEKSNFKEEICKVFDYNPDTTSFLGFKLEFQGLSCTITKENSAVYKIRESLKVLVETIAKTISDKVDNELKEQEEGINELENFLDSANLKFKSYEAKEEYERISEVRDVDSLSYGEDFVKCVQYLAEKQGDSIKDAVNKTYETFDTLEINIAEGTEAIGFISRYCLYGDDIYEHYFEIVSQIFNKELENL